MIFYADTGFLVSLYIKESTTQAATATFASLTAPISMVPLGILEVRNAFNLAIARGRITPADRDIQWATFLFHLSAGVLEERKVDTAQLHNLARQLSDRYTPTISSRSLDLLHVAAARLLGAGGSSPLIIGKPAWRLLKGWL
ncbi:hypothetical protein DB346_10320 [Verrucomicrobia bacterium LW23]|nr:hypothetical protein DB346_10320 [Verrucomicrobia bacterium LW23]